MIGRPRFFTNPEGQSVLGSTAVIRNEPTCADSSCHAHSADETVLGVLDIVAPLMDELGYPRPDIRAPRTRDERIRQYRQAKTLAMARRDMGSKS